MINSVQIMGSLSNNPVFSSKNGKSFAATSLMVTESFQHDGKTKESTSYVPISAFGMAADALSRMVAGDMAVVVGKLQSKSYEKDGKKVWSLEIVARQIHGVAVLGFDDVGAF